ncbi:MAG: YbaN family protein [Pseudomonadota bacterium]
MSGTGGALRQFPAFPHQGGWLTLWAMEKFSLSKPFWFVLGLIALVCGLAGVVLPLVPTTPFILLAAFCFARSSKRLSHWLENHPYFGPLIDNWRRHGSIDRRTKKVAMAVIVATPLISLALAVPLWILGVQVLVLTAVSIFILTRPDGPSS